ncbi:F-box domain-containing protein [Verticillium alfalfae VaMs.102]|uniref:F-box domain-containing protein n=1 Tax=Verticillium alfalfae (strain VaMs.102 / ATCC MYA-4576 / FGSC 10136) TaxID=526221 RepID=C9SHS6_VERA1|nr:F-box domain-containing protein [Verticillium alfalfae VaMs.102]EEY18499.1 F-box domain-containing protein [Verticillium alfalfae VaMs.102]
MDLLTGLPEDLLLLTLELLPPSQVVRCRLISRTIHHALTRANLCKHLLLSMLPRSREARLLRRLRENAEDAVVRAKDWSVVFAVAARRHHHQTTGAFSSAREVSLLPAENLFEGVMPWDTFLRFDDLTMPLYYDDVVWAYGSVEGLLVYPVSGQEYCALDLALGISQIVPFTAKGRIVRRVRLEHGVLVFEWAEQEAFHQLNEGEGVHRHFASAFDVWTDKEEYDTLPDLAYAPPASPLQGDGPVWVNECSDNTASPACRGAAFAMEEEDAWPGWAPCWRHEDFPYLTVAQVVDRAAGVRFSARQCFTMDVVSVNRDPEQGTASAALEGAKGADDDGALQREVRFADGTWAQIMAKGQIMGDERWLIGETAGRILTILYF